MTAGKRIVVWGDYDVDGTTGTALLVNFFRELDLEVIWHIPNRLREGYGLNLEWFRQQRGGVLSGDFLLITVDCGISDSFQINQIQQWGGAVIVTDHHKLPDQGLPACLILNPSQPTCGFHGEQLAGVGVAFYLAAGIRAELSARNHRGDPPRSLNLKQYLAFVALGTIADVVDLTVTNRILVRAGLEALRSTNFPGLQELLASCDISKGDISTEDIGYLLGPKINAAGRLGESDLVVNILTERNRKQAKSMTVRLTALNEERRRISADNLETALTVISSSRVDRDKCVIAHGPLHQGVAGIVASRLVEIYGLPSVVFAEKILADGSLVYVGSARSIDGMNIVQMFGTCSELIDRFGGHEMAAGLTVTAENMTPFMAKLSAVTRENWQNLVVKRKIRYDVECPVGSLMSEEYLDFFKLLEPFGPGNLQPIFQDSTARIVDSRVVGKDSEHLHLTIRGKRANFKGIGFSLGNRISEVQKEPKRSMIYTPTLNRYRGNISWQVRVIDL
jgi:single-stranded-DNA-specific exonuclease